MNTPLDRKMAEEQVNNLLVTYVATKDARVRDKIVLRYKNLVESIARRFSGSGEPIEDLAQEGYIGLITAIDLYDTKKGVKFSTYATHFIIGQIKHSLRDRGKIIKEPAWLQELNHRMTRVIDALYQEFGRQPTEAEIGQVMHIPEEMVASMLTTREVFKVSSLDNDQDESTNQGPDLDKIKDEKYVTFQLPVEDKIVLETSMNKLKIVEQKVIQDFYFTGLTQTEIAKKLGISCNYVSHILRSGTKKLRRILTTEELREVQTQLQLASRRPDDKTASANASVIDSLTRLYNAQYLRERLDEEALRAARSKYELAFALISIRGLEDFGRRFGALRLDDAVCSLAQTVKNCVRRCDIVGRSGEWEFALILPHTGKQVSLVCDRLRKAISKLEFDTGHSQLSLDFEVNTGHAVYPSDSSAVPDIWKIAEQALSHAEEQHKAA